MKRLYSTAAALVLAGALVLPTATSAQAANSDLTVFTTAPSKSMRENVSPSRTGMATTASNSRRVITSLDARSSRPSKVGMPSESTIR